MELLGPSLWDVWNGPADQALSEQYVACVAVEALTILEHLHAKGCGPAFGAHGALPQNRRGAGCHVEWGLAVSAVLIVASGSLRSSQSNASALVEDPTIGYHPSCFICHVQWVAGPFGAPSRYGHRIVRERMFCWGAWRLGVLAERCRLKT